MSSFLPPPLILTAYICSLTTPIAGAFLAAPLGGLIFALLTLLLRIGSLFVIAKLRGTRFTAFDRPPPPSPPVEERPEYAGGKGPGHEEEGGGDGGKYGTGAGTSSAVVAASEERAVDADAKGEGKGEGKWWKIW